MFKQRSIAERDDLDLRAFVLAGGDGTRLQSLTHKIDGDGRPKQFSKIFGGKTLLTHTRDRLRPFFSDDQVGPFNQYGVSKLMCKIVAFVQLFARTLERCII